MKGSCGFHLHLAESKTLLGLCNQDAWEVLKGVGKMSLCILKMNIRISGMGSKINIG